VAQRITKFRTAGVIVAMAIAVIAVEVSYVTHSWLGLLVVPFYLGGWTLGPRESHFVDDPVQERERIMQKFVLRCIVPFSGVYLTALALILLGLSFWLGILLGLGGLAAFGGFTARFAFSHKPQAAALPSIRKPTDNP
jgi:hypothetical protein